MAIKGTIEPAGFGNCGSCQLLQTGTVAVCSAYAGQTFADLPEERCRICDGALDDRGRCRNRMCSWTVDERHFSHVWAVSSNTGPLREAIRRYKYRGKWGWRLIFGRVLAGYLEARADVFASYDVMVPSPTYLGPDGRDRDHVADMVAAMQQESSIDWPVARDAIRKIAPTQKMADAPSWDARQRIAQNELRAALRVSAPDDVRGRRVLVFDDVFTGGHTLSEVARALRQAGASEVSQVVLARQTWDR